jgi:LDH2 family malate/lactate/ureidoglycolate dehydrogenase
VQLFRSLGKALPTGVASDPEGQDTEDAELAHMLAPLGGAFGFKGAGLAGMAEILSAVLTGMKLSFDILDMGGPDMSTPREMGAFVLAIHPDAFTDRARFDAGMRRYLETLRNSPARPGATLMAPGDREWAEAARREREGVRLDPATVSAFESLAGRHGIALPFDGLAGGAAPG